jgi:hypothetical protein
MQPLVDKPLFDPTYLNIDYVFAKIFDFISPIISFFGSSNTWIMIGIISAMMSIVCIAIIIFSLIRMHEIQDDEHYHLSHEIHNALLRDQESNRNDNPRWHYIQTLVESSNESDWRVAIIEADTMLDEVLAHKGIAGETLSEKLEQARSNGYRTLQNAWDAHLIRNQIAHSGLEFSLTQVEARRTIRLFHSFFEELEVI